jgi:hypothetical protein
LRKKAATTTQNLIVRAPNIMVKWKAAETNMKVNVDVVVARKSDSVAFAFEHKNELRYILISQAIRFNIIFHAVCNIHAQLK